MTKPKNREILGRMFIDETFYFTCPHCHKDYQFSIHENLKRRCHNCDKIQPIVNYKYGSETTYRNICNACREKARNRHSKNITYERKMTYTMMPCGSCLEEGKSLGEATVRVNSKGVFDSEGLHKHQEGIYKKPKLTDDPFRIN